MTACVVRLNVFGAVLGVAAGCFESAEPAPSQESSADSSEAKARPVLVDLVPSTGGEGYYAFDATAGAAKVSLHFSDAKAPLSLTVHTEPAAKVRLGERETQADGEGLATITLTPSDLVGAWLDGLKLERSSSAAPVNARLDVTLSTETPDRRRGEATLAIDLAGTATWWIHEQLDAKKDSIRPASSGALGVLLATPRGGLRYAGPGGGQETIGYLGSAMEQDPEVRDCGNYVSDDGKIGRITFGVVKEATALVDRATYTMTDEWTEPEDPCKTVVSGAAVGGTRRPEPLWSAAAIVEHWTRRVHKRGMWSTGTAKLENTGWLPVVLLDDVPCEGDQRRVRFPSENLNWDACVTPAALRRSKTTP
jgi:hypothetical protein